ncbi:hypothetical protein F4677DRAFT_421914 [Hypoxylon crocopeplum]|nr:hypothetical protein F4677DRAFT_421914 [Hypoxylon crocopeplum]
MANNNFRVIVIGGGPVGMIAAHALSKAGIDFIVLERRPVIAEDVGASLVLHAHGMRALAQFGLYDRLKEISAPGGTIWTNTDDGRVYCVIPGFTPFVAAYV